MPRKVTKRAPNTARSNPKPPKAKQEPAREDPVALTQTESPPIPKNWKLAIIVAVLVLTALIHSRTLQNGFIYFDDPELVADNYSIRELTLDNIIFYFTRPVQMTYLPIGLLSYAIDYRLGGGEPFIYHLNNLVYHLLTVILVIWLFHKLTKNFYIAIFVGALLAIHPVNVDTVAWVATRNNILTTLFYIAALLFYTYYIESKYKVKYLVFASIAFTLSVLSKSSSVILPVVLFLWDYYYNRKLDRRLLLEKVPFLVISLIFGIITLNIRTDVIPPVEYNLFDRLILFSYSLLDYLARLVFPNQLSMAYTYPEKNGMFLPAQLYLSPFILAAIVWLLYKLKVPVKILIIGLLFFALNIFLSQSTFLIDNFKANRYAYLSYIGLFFVLAVITEQIRHAQIGWRSRIKDVWLAALAVFVIAISYVTYTRYAVWKDTITLFDDVIAKQPDMPWVYNSRGIAKYKANDFNGALQDFNHALSIDPNFPLSLYYRGLISYQSNDYQNALADLDASISLVPDFANAYNDRGKVKKALQDYQGALDDFSKTISLKDRFVDAYFNRATLKYDMGDYQGAIADYSTAILYYPEYPDAFYNRGLAKVALGDYQGSISDFSQAIALFPNYADAFGMRSVAKLNLNDLSGSCEDLSTAKSLGYQPDPQRDNQNCPT